jgi:fumarate reductase subunit D
MTIEDITRRSGRTVLWVQIGEGILLVAAFAAIIILVFGIILPDHNKIGHQQAIILAQQNRLLAEQQRIATIAAANTAEGRRVKFALCDSQFTVATITVPAGATKVLVQFVEASRKAYTVLGCPGRLGPPPKDLLAAGKKWGVPIRY